MFYGEKLLSFKLSVIPNILLPKISDFTFFQNYKHLIQLSGENARNLQIIESAICVLTLEPNIHPNSASEVTMATIAGDYKNIWADKSIQITFFGNGRSGGLADVSFSQYEATLICIFFAFISLDLFIFHFVAHCF